MVKEEIIDVVSPIAQGQPKPSLYILIPLQLRNRLGINEDTQFVVLLAENGDIIYRQKEA
jgi:hypothetical protein